MKKNDINKDNVNLVQSFVDIVNKDNLSELEYEADGIKVKIVSKNYLQDKPQAQIIQKGKNKKLRNYLKKIQKPQNLLAIILELLIHLCRNCLFCTRTRKRTIIKLNGSVSKGEILIIEAMKVMNTITAHKSGKVVFIDLKIVNQLNLMNY